MAGVVLGLLLVTGGACDEKETPRPAAPAATSDRTAPEPPPTAGPAAPTGDAGAPVGAGTGLAAPDNDPRLATAARRVRGCPYEARLDERSCPAFAALADVAGDVPPARASATLVNLLADETPAVRFAGAELLRRRTWPPAVRGDEERADRIVAALAAETDPAVAEALGVVAGRLPLGAGARRERVLELLRSHPRPEARKGLLAHLLYTNRDARSVLHAVHDAATGDPDVGVRRSALSAFWNLGPDREADVVPLWREALRDREADVAAKAAYLLGNWQQGVAEGFPDVVAVTRERGEAGTATWELLSGLLWYLRNDRPFVDRDAVFAAARAVATNRANPWMARNKALDLMQTAGGADAAEALRPFLKDPEPLVARHAKKLLKPLAP